MCVTYCAVHHFQQQTSLTDRPANLKRYISPLWRNKYCPAPTLPPGKACFLGLGMSRSMPTTERKRAGFQFQFQVSTKRVRRGTVTVQGSDNLRWFDNSAHQIRAHFFIVAIVGSLSHVYVGEFLPGASLSPEARGRLGWCSCVASKLSTQSPHEAQHSQYTFIYIHGSSWKTKERCTIAQTYHSTYIHTTYTHTHMSHARVIYTYTYIHRAIVSSHVKTCAPAQSHTDTLASTLPTGMSSIPLTWCATAHSKHRTNTAPKTLKCKGRDCQKCLFAPDNSCDIPFGSILKSGSNYCAFRHEGHRARIPLQLRILLMHKWSDLLDKP